MSQSPFDDFFRTATGNSPYGYQCRLACGPQASPDHTETLRAGADCHSQLINIPTGLGKTAAVVLAWLWNRARVQKSDWPRRLVYCLPMRTLVEQTQEEVENWLKKLGLSKTVSVHILMGGEEAGEWDIYPEKLAILIGTQDMLLSRALNRGYGMSRYRWPMHFGLLNNDCLWVMDETQLMGVGVETSAQLDGFRGTWATMGACRTWWMSATLHKARLITVDHPTPTQGWPEVTLSDEEKAQDGPKDLFEASKPVQSCNLALSATTKNDYAKQLAQLVHERHQALLQNPLPSGTLTLVIVNRVSRAREIYEHLIGGKKPLNDPANVALIHSRFRRPDRRRHEELLFGNGNRIVIATQAVEAGVDVSARLLITELAPWSSLVQRIGRCNRRADMTDAQVLWVDIQPKDEKDELLRPYSKPELDKARDAISSLSEASPRRLQSIVVPEEPVIRPVIRRRDLVDLFDTTPDICGQDLDISRYIRDGGDTDVQLFWREVDADVPKETLQPSRDELCRVSIGDAVKFFEKKTTNAWLWNALERKWETANKPRPGGVYLLSKASGGYDDALGWTGDPKDKPTPYAPGDSKPEGHDDEPETFSHSWQTLAEHTGLVVQQTEALARVVIKEPGFVTALRSAAQWHDLGKAHEAFQEMLRQGDATRKDELWAKSEHKNGRCDRHGFRHELASALAWLLSGPKDAKERDLIAYLIAAHHGKVRLSIRSLPGETGDRDKPAALFARGIWQGDILPAVTCGDLSTPKTVLDLSFMQMGEGPQGLSWLARTVALRDRLGPFQLAYLETILRAADACASRND